VHGEGGGGWVREGQWMRREQRGEGREERGGYVVVVVVVAAVARVGYLDGASDAIDDVILHALEDAARDDDGVNDHREPRRSEHEVRRSTRSISGALDGNAHLSTRGIEQGTCASGLSAASRRFEPVRGYIGLLEGGGIVDTVACHAD
jgi:hypothetical protein